MAIELQVTVQVADTEPDAGGAGVILRHARILPIVSESPNLPDIMAVATALSDRAIDEVKSEFMDSLKSVSAQPHM